MQSWFAKFFETVDTSLRDQRGRRLKSKDIDDTLKAGWAWVFVSYVRLQDSENREGGEVPQLLRLQEKLEYLIV